MSKITKLCRHSKKLCLEYCKLFFPKIRIRRPKN